MYYEKYQNSIYYGYVYISFLFFGKKNIINTIVHYSQ